MLAAAGFYSATIAARPVPAQAAPTVFRCTNPVSGAQWNVTVDFAQKTVDSWPATITGRRISWHDRADEGFYSMDRATGDLRILRASSTGGYEQHDFCRPG